MQERYVGRGLEHWPSGSLLRVVGTTSAVGEVVAFVSGIKVAYTELTSLKVHNLVGIGQNITALDKNGPFFCNQAVSCAAYHIECDWKYAH